MKASPTIWVGRVLTGLFALFMLGASIYPKFFMPEMVAANMGPSGWTPDKTLLHFQGASLSYRKALSQVEALAGHLQHSCGVRANPAQAPAAATAFSNWAANQLSRRARNKHRISPGQALEP